MAASSASRASRSATRPATLADADGGTDVLAVNDGLPRGVPTTDNEAGWRDALAKLASPVQGGGYT
jgi:hypothetical protein